MDKLEIVGGYDRELTDSEYTIIRKMMLEEEGIKEIFGRNERILDAILGGLVKYDDDYIGFFLLVKERIDNILFVDRALKKDYREKGIGTFMMEYIVNCFPSDNYYLISETTNDNMNARYSAAKIGKLIYTKDNLRYYLLNKSEQQFRNSGMYEKFVEYENKPKIKSRDLIREIMNER